MASGSIRPLMCVEAYTEPPSTSGGLSISEFLMMYDQAMSTTLRMTSQNGRLPGCLPLWSHGTRSSFPTLTLVALPDSRGRTSGASRESDMMAARGWWLRTHRVIPSGCGCAQRV